MVYNKQMLAGAVEIARTEKDDPALRCILLEPDGTVIAHNRWAIYITQPTLSETLKVLPFNGEKLLETRAVSFDQIATMLKSVPADKQFNGMLEHIDISPSAGETVVLTYEYHNGKGIGRGTLRCSQVASAIAGWRERLKIISSVEKIENKDEYLFNRKRIVAVVGAIEAACRYDGEFAYIRQRHFEGGYVWVALNELTKQTVIVVHVQPRLTAESGKATDFERLILPEKTERKMRLWKTN